MRFARSTVAQGTGDIGARNVVQVRIEVSVTGAQLSYHRNQLAVASVEELVRSAFEPAGVVLPFGLRFPKSFPVSYNCCLGRAFEVGQPHRTSTSCGRLGSPFGTGVGQIVAGHLSVTRHPPYAQHVSVLAEHV
jgi:hypothetical protein